MIRDKKTDKQNELMKQVSSWIGNAEVKMKSLYWMKHTALNYGTW